ncbi:MAG: phosphatidylglycerophosphatase A [Alphaproteobacteria bacterium]
MRLFADFSKRHHKSFNLSLSPLHWSSLIVSVGNIGYLPKYHWSHFGALSMSILPPLVLVGVGAHHNPLASLLVLVGSCLMAYAALIHIHTHGVDTDHDASAIVVDELAGSSMAALAIPTMMHLMGTHTVFDAILCALLVGWLFRFFDIAKPAPANQMDALWHHPFSVMADDLVAGFYAALLGIGFAAWINF